MLVSVFPQTVVQQQLQDDFLTYILLSGLIFVTCMLPSLHVFSYGTARTVPLGLILSPRASR
jgi:hypothetical protein